MVSLARLVRGLLGSRNAPLKEEEHFWRAYLSKVQQTADAAWRAAYANDAPIVTQRVTLPSDVEATLKRNLVVHGEYFMHFPQHWGVFTGVPSLPSNDRYDHMTIPTFVAVYLDAYRSHNRKGSLDVVTVSLEEALARPTSYERICFGSTADQYARDWPQSPEEALQPWNLQVEQYVIPTALRALVIGSVTAEDSQRIQEWYDAQLDKVKNAHLPCNAYGQPVVQPGQFTKEAVAFPFRYGPLVNTVMNLPRDNGAGAARVRREIEETYNVLMRGGNPAPGAAASGIRILHRERYGNGSVI